MTRGRPTGLRCCVDVQYSDALASVGCVGFDAWGDASPRATWSVRVPVVGDYVPGEFYRRELAPIVAALAASPDPLSLVVIDAYVDLAPDRPGLGRRLFDTLGLPVVGIAKTPFHGAFHAVPVQRGSSKRPLFVTAAGLDPDEAAREVAAMAGAHRIPTLVKLADSIARRSLVA